MQLRASIGALFIFLICNGVVAPEENTGTSDESGGNACVCGERVPWGWASCPWDRMKVCDTCYRPGEGIIAYVERTPGYQPGSGCQNLAAPGVALVADNPEELQQMQDAGGTCSLESSRDANRYICQNVSPTFQLGDTQSKLVTGIQDVSYSDAQKKLKGNSTAISWDSFFNNLYGSIKTQWMQRHGTPATASGSYVICKSDSGEYGVSQANLYGNDEIVRDIKGVLSSLPGRALMFPPRSKVCALEVNADFSYTLGTPTSKQAERHVFEMDGKLYRYSGKYISL
jgi:hypothetical protein